MYKLITAILVLAMACVSVQAESVENSSTNNSVYVVMETAAGVPTAGLTIAELDLYYQEYQVAQAAKVDLTALAAANTAHTDNYAFSVGNGLYRIDLPDAAFDGGIGTQVTIMVVDPNGTYRTAFLTVELSPAVDATTVNGDTPIAVDDIWDEVIAEATDAPAADSTAREIISYMRAAFTGKMVTNETTGEIEWYNFAGTKVFEQPYSDSGTAFTKNAVELDD